MLEPSTTTASPGTGLSAALDTCPVINELGVAPSDSRSKGETVPPGVDIFSPPNLKKDTWFLLYPILSHLVSCVPSSKSVSILDSGLDTLILSTASRP